MGQIRIEWRSVALEGNPEQHLYLIYRPDGEETPYEDWLLLRAGAG
jgi:hypothetical protein